MLEHETLITELRLHFRDYPFKRSVRVGSTTADALLEKDGNRFFIEVDTNRMSSRQMQAKVQRYPTQMSDFILFICLTETRMRRLVEYAARVKNVSLFSTFERLRSGHTQPWVDGYGRTASV